MAQGKRKQQQQDSENIFLVGLVGLGIITFKIMIWEIL